MTALIGLRSYLFRYRAYIIGGLVFIILANAVALIQPYLIRLAVDSLHIGLDPQVLLRYGLLIVLAGLLQAILQFFGRYLQSVAARRIEYELRGDLFKHFEKLEIDYFQHNKQGDLVARAINDLTAVRGLLGPGISNLMNTTVALPAKSRELAGGSLKGKVEFRHVSFSYFQRSATLIASLFYIKAASWSRAVTMSFCTARGSIASCTSFNTLNKNTLENERFC